MLSCIDVFLCASASVYLCVGTFFFISYDIGSQMIYIRTYLMTLTVIALMDICFQKLQVLQLFASYFKSQSHGSYRVFVCLLKVYVHSKMSSCNRSLILSTRTMLHIAKWTKTKSWRMILDEKVTACLQTLYVNVRLCFPCYIFLTPTHIIKPLFISTNGQHRHIIKRCCNFQFEMPFHFLRKCYKCIRQCRWNTKITVIADMK